MAYPRHIGGTHAHRVLQAPGLVIVAFFVANLATLRAVEGAEGITAVSSRVSKDYVRAKLADGSYQPEEYAFGNGGDYGGPIHDDTIDKMSFTDIAKLIAGPLADQKYIPSRDPAKTKLVIMVYWGTTDVPEAISTTNAYQNYQLALQEYNEILAGNKSYWAQNAADAVLSAGLVQLNWENNRRDKIDYKNADLLGYNSPDGRQLIGTARGNQMEFTALRGARNDLVSEIEGNRYFVVLMAYDFQVLWKQKKHRLLWETRLSINQPRNDFGKALPAMAKFASSFFGQASHGLVRQANRGGNVKVGEPTLIELLNP